MADKERKTVVQNGREVSPGEGDQSIKPSRVCRHDEGKTGREEEWQAVRRATKTHSSEDREI